jgi:hypothetical protein
MLPGVFVICLVTVLVTVICGMTQVGGLGPQPCGTTVIAIVGGMGGQAVQAHGMVALHRMGVVTVVVVVMVILGAGRSGGECAQGNSREANNGGGFAKIVHAKVPFNRGGCPRVLPEAT